MIRRKLPQVLVLSVVVFLLAAAQIQADLGRVERASDLDRHDGAHAVLPKERIRQLQED